MIYYKYSFKDNKDYLIMKDEVELNCLVIGLGDRGSRFCYVSKELGGRVVAIAEPDNKKRDFFADKYDIPRELMFEYGEDALESGLPFDAVYIATPDKTHFKLAVLALNKGYNVLLEKPMAPDPTQCIKILKAQEKSKKSLAVCHVLRYAPFFQTIKKIADSGELGKIISIDLIEEIGYWHFAHSYVRGNWRKEEESSPIILAKSCHDLDIISWLAESTPKSVFSKGSLDIFKQENAPKTSTERCINCPVKDCLYDARKFYLNHKGEIRWPYNVISPTDLSEEARLEAIKKGPYGRCVFKCDNNVCDNQEVLIYFKNKIRASFILRAGGFQPTRKINVYFERGEISGNMWRGKITKIKYTGRRNEDEIEEIDTHSLGSHGGGDPRLIKDFFGTINSQNYEDNLTSAQKSLQSHLIAFAAEKSRKMGKFGRVVNYERYVKELGIITKE